MEHFWYNIIRFYVKVGLFFTLKKIHVFGKENIPKKGAVMFIGNHQNALIDAILIPTTNTRNIHFLTRASVFKNKFISNILQSLNLIPVYRIRDGKNSIQKNIEIFNKCFEILKNESAIQIFAEGEHHLYRRVLPLKKGFARIILGTLQKYPDVQIQIVPVGINYDSHLNFPASASVYYGKPISANTNFNINNPDYSFKEIQSVVRESLKKLTLHIENIEKYDETIAQLEMAQVNYLNPIEANILLKKGTLSPKKITSKKINWFLPIHLLMKVNSIFPLLIWYYLKPKIVEIVFSNTFRFALIVTIIPLFYCLQAWIIFEVSNLFNAISYLVLTIIIGLITVKTMPISR